MGIGVCYDIFQDSIRVSDLFGLDIWGLTLKTFGVNLRITRKQMIIITKFARIDLHLESKYGALPGRERQS